jgi:uncharacterized protein YbjT (DUF2867 family)
VSAADAAIGKRRNALLLGATGLIGSRCLTHLLECDSYARVTCLVRRRLELSHERLDERIVDFDDRAGLEKKLSDLEIVDDLFCAIGSTMKKAGSKEAFRRVDYDLPLSVAEIVCGVGRGSEPRTKNERTAKRMALVSSVGADARASNFYLKTKGELEDALTPLFAPLLHIFRPSFLVGDRQESRPGEAIGIAVVRATKGLMFGGLRKYRPIHVDHVARAMVAAMLGTDPKTKKVYEHDDIQSLAKAL